MGAARTLSNKNGGTAFPISRRANATGHSVQFYLDDQVLIDDLGRSVGAAFGAGDAVVIIATPEHRQSLEDLLRLRGLNVESAVKAGRYLALDAAKTLDQFMSGNWPDTTRFFEVMHSVLHSAQEAAQKESPRVFAFGEMVSLLVAAGRGAAALRLEQLWNELSKAHAFHLHCAYPMNLFAGSNDAEIVQKICEEHGHVTPAETFTNLSSEEDRRVAIALLQQKAKALENEIHEREKAQQVLLEREAELRDFVENAVVPLHWVGRDATILWANNAELNLLGYSAEEYIGHNITEFHADTDAINDILRRLARGEELHGAKSTLRCKNGGTRVVRIYSNVLRHNNAFVHTRCFTIDVTDRERSERRLAAQLAITRLLAESESFDDLAPCLIEAVCQAMDCDMGAIWEIQPGGEELKCVKVCHRAPSGFPHFEPETEGSRLQKGKGLPGRVWQSNRAAWIADLLLEGNFPRKAAAVNDGLRSAFAFPIVMQGQVSGVVEFYSRQVREPDAEFQSMMNAVGIQIGQFAERKLIANLRSRLAAIVESSHDAIISKDLNGIVTSWNHGAERTFGYKAEQIIGRPISVIIPPELHGEEPEILAKIQAGQRIEQFETVRLTKDGERVDVSVTISPVRDQQGNIIGAAKIARDITQQKKMENALHTAERLASVGRLAATVAHEINNPLESITNLVFLAKTSPSLEPHLRQYLDSADQELRRVAHIVCQTLGFYRDGSDPAWVDLGKIIDDVAMIYHRKFESKNIDFRRKATGPLEIHALEGRLKQVLSNLIANAIDASKSGGAITVAAHPAIDATGRRGFRLLVADSGEGIAPENRKRLFTPFFTTKKEVGTGLGLWITKDLVEKSGGRIDMRSRIGEPSGTVVSIFLPRQSAPENVRSNSRLAG